MYKGLYATMMVDLPVGLLNKFGKKKGFEVVFIFLSSVFMQSRSCVLAANRGFCVQFRVG